MKKAEGMSIEEMIARFSPKQDDIAKEVRKEMKSVSVFECNGVLFKGNPYHAATLFAHNNPLGGDFYAWVQDNYKTLGLV